MSPNLALFLDELCCLLEDHNMRVCIGGYDAEVWIEHGDGTIFISFGPGDIDRNVINKILSYEHVNPKDKIWSIKDAT